MPNISTGKLGLWFIGARGGVAVTSILGLIAQRRRLAGSHGLVTELSPWTELPLPSWDEFVLGGHEIRSASIGEEIERLHRESRVFEPEMLESCAADLAQVDDQVRPGTLWNVGPAIAELASDATRVVDSTAGEAVQRIRDDLEQFRSRHALDSVVVMNLASTEPMPPQHCWPTTWNEAEKMLAQRDCPLPASSLYAIAALDLGLPYVNFTPSLGALPPGIDELARLRGACYAGRDGKTGETLLKSVLAPMFAARHLKVMSWVGHNIFGNLDGKVLDDPRNKSTKVTSKDQLLAKILGYSPQTLVSIEHIASLGDWKTAWDHVHFEGFLGTPMTLQLTWQGCDSLLAAPLVLDLARITLFAQQRGEIGPLMFLSSFFKSPAGDAPQAFADQFQALLQWADGAR